MEKKAISPMGDESGAQPLCAQEALDLLNCVTQSNFDQDRCVRLLQSLRDCVLTKKVKKFTLADQGQPDGNQVSKKA